MTSVSKEAEGKSHSYWGNSDLKPFIVLAFICPGCPGTGLLRFRSSPLSHPGWQGSSHSGLPWKGVSDGLALSSGCPLLFFAVATAQVYQVAREFTHNQLPAEQGLWGLWVLTHALRRRQSGMRSSGVKPMALDRHLSLGIGQETINRGDSE